MEDTKKDLKKGKSGVVALTGVCDERRMNMIIDNCYERMLEGENGVIIVTDRDLREVVAMFIYKHMRYKFGYEDISLEDVKNRENLEEDKNSIISGVVEDFIQDKDMGKVAVMGNGKVYVENIEEYLNYVKENRFDIDWMGVTDVESLYKGEEGETLNVYMVLEMISFMYGEEGITVIVGKRGV